MVDRYFIHSQKCGSGETSLQVKWSHDDEITLYYSRHWMGGDSNGQNCDLVCRGGKVVRANLQFYSIIEFPKHLVCLDAFTFTEPLQSEWNQPLPIGLYYGNGPSSTETFSLVLFVNRLASEVHKHHKMFDWISSMKLEPQTQEHFESNVKRVKVWTEVEGARSAPSNPLLK
jgi:hypothetical protein